MKYFLMLFLTAHSIGLFANNGEGDKYLNEARKAYKINDLNSAMLYNKLAIMDFEKEKDDVGLSKAHHYTGRIFLSMNNADSSESHFMKAINLLSQKAKNETKLQSDVYNSYGMLNYELGSFSVAKKYFEHALQGRLKISKETKELIWQSYNNIGNALFMLGDITRARENYSTAYDYVSKTNNLFGKKTALNNLAKCYIADERPNEALNYLEKSLKYFTSYSTEYYLGKVYAQLNNFKKGEEFLLKSLKGRELKLPSKNHLLTETYVTVGDLYFQQGMFDKALHYYNLGEENQTIKGNYFGHHLVNNIYSIDVLYKIILAEYYMGVENNQTNIWRSCQNHIEQILNAFDQLRVSHVNEESKLFLQEQTFAIYNDILEILFQMRVSMEPSYIENLIFIIIEKSKSLLLYDEIVGTFSKNSNILPEDIRQLEEKYKQTERNFYLANYENIEWGEFNSYEEFYLEYKYFRNRLEKEYYEYYKLKYESKIHTLKELQYRIDSKTVLVNYFLGRKYVFAIITSGDNTKLWRKELSSDWKENLSQYLIALKKFNKTNYFKYALILSKQFTNEIFSNFSELDNVIIIPSGVLYSIPFEALIDGKDNNFLVESYNIKYHYSANLLLNSRERSCENFDYDIMVAAPFVNSSDNTKYLQYSKQEVREILSYSKFRTYSLDQFDFNRDFFLKSKIKTKILHFATHTLIDIDNFYNSKIELSQDGTNDLFFLDLFSLSVTCETVMLSSCESGIGKLSLGEGMLSLHRGFFYSGANNIIFSLWNVFDKNASILMKSFYQNLSENWDYTKALRNAKLEMIDNPKYNFPGFWSSFILIGE